MGFLKSKTKNTPEKPTKGQNTTEKPNKKSWFGKQIIAKKVEHTEQKLGNTSSSASFVPAISNDLSIVQSNSSSSLSKVHVDVALKNTKSFDKRLLETEKNIQKQVKNASKRKDLKLQSSGGVLLFEGMNQETDECHINELRQVDSAITAQRSYETDFVEVSGNYDPVKNGFLKKNKKNYYDSDDEGNVNSAPKSQSTDSSSFWGLLGGGSK
mmetsp:Transcript_2346/g.3605  ORF Transcript_2346/g.3605 Transcript_2346/m.3605 type:complete len:212 (-) Transcript_2346:150-785(-)